MAFHWNRAWKALAATAALAACALAGAQPAALKIGFLAELSGPQAALGQDTFDAFMLVVDRNGGKLGGVPVEILKEDTQAKPEVAAQVVQRLIEREKTPIIAGLTLSNIVMAVHRPITQSETFLVGVYAGPSPIAGAQCSPYGFIVSRENEVQSYAMAQFAMKSGFKTVALLAPNYQGGKDTIAGFKRLYKGQIVSETYTPMNQLDFSVELSKVQVQKPEAVFAFYPGGLGVAFVRQYRQSGLMQKVPLLSVGTADALTLPALKEAALGLYSASIWATDSTLPASRRFVEAFEARTGRIPSDLAASSYDAAQLLDAAIAKVKGNVADKKAFMAALKTVPFDSVRGSIKFGNNNFPVQDIHVMQVAKDARQRVSLKRVDTLHDVQDVYHDQCGMQ